MSTFEDSVRFCPFHGTELKPLPDRQFLPGETVCGYYLQKIIGHDGLGDVYRATRSGNTYRLRLYSDALLCDSGRVSRLHEILEKSTQISGGGVPIVDFDWFDDGALYSAHPFIPGHSFQDILNLDVTLSEFHVAELLFQLLRAVKDIHGQRLINGNIALSNIILDNSGRIRMHDIGLWDIFRGDHFSELRDDHPEVFEDIVDLMAPEVARGDQPQAHSDVYSCGAAAYCLLTHQAGIGSVSDRLAKHLSGETQDIRVTNPRVRISDDFADLLLSSTLGSSGVRFQTTRAFMTALLSIHTELDESCDSLSLELLDLLADSSERPDHQGKQHSAFTNFPDNQWQDSQRAEIESTRKGIDPGRTVVEKASWADLAELVGDNLETTALTDIMERAVTTEMDPFEASPTQEMPKALFSADAARQSNDSNPFADILETISAIDASKKEDIPFPGLRFGSDDSSAQDKSKAVQDSQEKSKDTAKDSQEKSKDTAKDSQEKSKDTAKEAAPEKTKDSKSKDLDDKKSDASQAPQRSTSSEELAALPHKRINRKKPEDSEDNTLKSGDVVAVTDRMQMRRIKRKNRRRDFEPQNEVITAEVPVESMADPAAKPEFSNLPTLTSTHGYMLEEGEESDIKPITVNAAEPGEITAAIPIESLKATTEETAESEEDEDNDDAMDWFGDEEPKPTRHSNKKMILVAVIAICLLGAACVVVALEKFGGDTSAPKTAELNADSLAQIQKFHDALEKATPESRKEADTILNGLRKMDIGREEIKKLRTEYADALQNQAKALRANLKKSEAIPNPFDFSRSEMDAAYISCTSAIDAALPDAEDQKQQCETARQSALDAAQAKAETEASKQRPELQKQFDGWNELNEIYAGLQKQQQFNPIPNLGESIEESSSEKNAYQSRLNQIPDKNTAVALAPAQPQNEDVAEVPANAPDNQAALQGEGLAQETQPEPPAPQEPQNPQEVPPVQEPQVAQAAPVQAAPVQPAPTPAQPQQAQPAPQPNTKSANQQAAANTAQTKTAQPEPAAQPNKAPSNTRPSDSEWALRLIDPAEPPSAAKPMPQPSNQNANTPEQKTNSAGEATAQATGSNKGKRISLDDDDDDAQPAKPIIIDADKTTANAKANEKAGDKAANTAKAPETAKAADAGKAGDSAKANNAKAADTAKAAPSGASADSLLKEANAALAKKDFATATELLTQATKQDPKNAMAWYRLAQVSEKQGKVSAACTYAEKSCAISKKVTCYNYLGSLREKAGMHSEAQDAYRKALEIDPNDPTAKSKLN
ncbi:MAG: tetratricopeptide repeat protein [Proteobacteria bacterium]|nr:tetratricopeptide repeat protein [Pseudomonadota bacterium]